MGCFLACFGFHKNRKKRRSPADGVLTIRDQIHLSYEPLDSSRVTTCDTNETLEIQNSKPRGRANEQPSVKIRKKVSFNLNVQTYEPVPNDAYFLESDEEVNTEGHCQEATTRIDATPLPNKAFTNSNSGNYPQNHRYQNCEDSYDDEEVDSENGESDLNDIESDETNDEFRSCELETSSIVDGSQQVHSVLKPIENLTQWRTAKAKAGSITKQHQIQNKNTQMQENDMVHSSLSDWLVRIN